MITTLAPALKGQLTKAVKMYNTSAMAGQHLYHYIRNVFSRHMPPEQAKHAARKYLAAREGGAR